MKTLPAKEELEKLEKLRADFEEKRGINYPWSEAMDAYAWWMSLMDADKKKSLGEWDNYFEQCRKSDAYKIYKTQSEAFSKGDMGTVKDLGLVASGKVESGRQQISKPKGRDPRWIWANQYVLQYRKALRDIDRLKNKSVELSGGWN